MSTVNNRPQRATEIPQLTAEAPMPPAEVGIVCGWAAAGAVGIPVAFEASADRPADRRAVIRYAGLFVPGTTAACALGIARVSNETVEVLVPSATALSSLGVLTYAAIEGDLTRAVTDASLPVAAVIFTVSTILLADTLPDYLQNHDLAIQVSPTNFGLAGSF